MIDYETYKILHIFTIMMTITAMGAVLADGKWIPNKAFKIGLAVFSFLIFVGGMGLIARLNFKHGQSFPDWIWLKIAMWVVFNVCLVMLFKVKKNTYKMLSGALAALSVFVAIYTAITKLA